ncbi:MAG: aminotransferase class V-fold PLP-dependent enzyme [Butyricicoccus sp.]
MIYLDNAATTLQKPASVMTAVRQAMNRAASAGRSAHRPAVLAADILFDTRALAAEFFELDDSSRVIFTSNATMALNTAIFSMAEYARRFAVTGMEHNAVMRPMHKLSHQGKRVTVLDTPLWKPERLLDSAEKTCKNGVDCFVVNHVSNVYGYELPLEELDGVLRRYGVPMIVDASQSAGVCPLSARRLRSAAAICMPGHKGLYGPQGTGMLLSLTEEIQAPLLYGGTGSRSISPNMPEDLPDRLEAGTHNIAGVAGLFEGIRFVRMVGVDQIREHETILRRQLASQLKNVSQLHCFTTSRDELQTGVLSITCDTMSAEQLSMRLAERGICVRAGLHCAPLAHRTGGTLESGTVRLSPGWFQNLHQIRRTTESIRDIVQNG